VPVYFYLTTFFTAFAAYAAYAGTIGIGSLTSGT